MEERLVGKVVEEKETTWQKHKRCEEHGEEYVRYAELIGNDIKAADDCRVGYPSLCRLKEKYGKKGDDHALKPGQSLAGHRLLDRWPSDVDDGPWVDLLGKILHKLSKDQAEMEKLRQRIRLLEGQLKTQGAERNRRQRELLMEVMEKVES